MIRIGLALFGLCAAYSVAHPILIHAAALIQQATDLIP
jgi:hypothetical protein